MYLFIHINILYVNINLPMNTADTHTLLLSVLNASQG